MSKRDQIDILEEQISELRHKIDSYERELIHPDLSDGEASSLSVDISNLEKDLSVLESQLSGLTLIDNDTPNQIVLAHLYWLMHELGEYFTYSIERSSDGLSHKITLHTKRWDSHYNSYKIIYNHITHMVDFPDSSKALVRLGNLDLIVKYCVSQTK